MLTVILIFGCFGAMCLIQSTDVKKLSKRISDLEKEIKSDPEVDVEKSN